MRKDLKQHVKQCDVCQRLKNETCHPARLLQPLPILEKLGLDVSMNFIEGLPKSQMRNVVFMVVNRLTMLILSIFLILILLLRLPTFICRLFSNYMVCLLLL